MKISFLIPAMVLYIVRESFCYDIQVGTVLFTKTDIVRKCWTESDKALLRARLVMQDVLPDPRCIDFSKPRAVSIIFDYFYACFHIIRTSTYGKLQNLMYLALADAVGGYLRAYVLPLTKKSYYAGLVTYDDACRVFTFYDQIREYLKTTGAGWAQPQKVVFKNIKISPLEIVGGNPSACKVLYTIEKKGKLHCISAKCCPKASKLPDLQITEMPEQTITTENFTPSTSTPTPKTTIEATSSSTPKVSAAVKDSKSHLRETVRDTEISRNEKNISSSEKPFKHLGDLHLENETMEEIMEEINEGRSSRCDCCERKKAESKVKTPKRIIIPLPILDDECDPHTIAVPFRKRPLRNLWRKTSAFILEHYYVAVLQCFISKGNTRSDIKNFNSQFHSWLTSQVYPRLEDEKWYPAFGGILRVTETIKRFGAEARLNDPMSHDIAFMFRKGVGFDYPENGEKSNSKDKTRDIGHIEYYPPNKSHRYYALATLVAAAVWFVVFCGCAFLCLSVKGKRSDSGESGRSRTSLDHRVPPSRRSESSTPGKKAVSFQFLVRFFKKNEHVFNNSNESSNGRQPLEDSNRKEIMERKRPTFKQNEGKQQTMTSSGDVPCYLVSHLREQEKSSQACTPLFPLEEFDLSKRAENAAGEGPVPRGATPRVQSSNVVQTLWKNPFLRSVNVTNARGSDTKKRSWFRLGAKKKQPETSTSKSISRSTSDSKSSTNKSLSRSCSEGCPNSCTSTTNCTSHTQLEEDYSSATMEFFENVISRHKPAKKRFEQKSSTEPESDDSCTSEN